MAHTPHIDIAHNAITHRARRIAASVAAICCTLAMVAGCGAADDAADSSGSRNSIVTVNSTEPTKGLIPSNTNDMAGWRIASLIYDGLVTFSTSGELQYVEAKSIAANADATEYTITLKPNLKFSNGEKITASTYAKSWSFAANAANGQVGASTLATIKGYDKLQDANGDKNAQLSGLHVVDDSTLKVELNQPDSSFPYKVGDIAFLPISSKAIKDPEAYGKKPIGNGPYKVKLWTVNEDLELEKDPSYNGPRKPKNDGIDFRVYQSLNAAYSDLLAGNLDVLDSIPTVALGSYRKERRAKAVNRQGPSFVSFTIPQSLEHFQGEEGRLRRAAISQAIDRNAIAKAIFRNTVTPATDFLAPVIKGHSTKLDTSGVLSYDAAKARDLWKRADAISSWSGSFRIAYGADSTDKEWVDATVNSIRNVLGIDAQSYPFSTSKELSSAINERKVGAAFKSGLQSDYPHPEGYLVQGYDSSQADGKGLNNGDYKSAEFDALIDKASAQPDLDKAVATYQEAQKVLLKDLPVIPLWYKNVTAAAGRHVNADFNYMGVPDYVNITKSH